MLPNPFIGTPLSRVRCPDCPALDGEDHVKGCAWKAVQDGKLTPRERQVMIVERRMSLGIERAEIPGSLTFERGLRLAIDSGAAFIRGAVVRMNFEDIVRLTRELNLPPPHARAGTPEAPLTYHGHRVVQDNSVPLGFIDVVPEKVQSIIEGAPADMNTQVGVIAGFDPARDGPPVFSMRNSNGVFRLSGLA